MTWIPLRLQDGTPVFGKVVVPVDIIDNLGNIVDTIDANGFQRVEHRDEYPGDEWNTPQAGAAIPAVANVTIAGLLMRTRQFVHNTENRMSNMFEIQHDIDCHAVNAGTKTMEVHVHCKPSNNNAGNVQWWFDWNYAPVHAAPIAMASLSWIQPFEVNRQHWHHVEGVNLPVPAGGYEIGGVINFNIRRTPAGAADTYGAAVIFDKCALHVPINSRGSRQRYVK